MKLLGHRYYDSDTGRFLTRDPVKDGRNWYGYCGNNPVTRLDPTGLEWYVWTGVSGGSVVLGGGITVSVGIDDNGDLIFGAEGQFGFSAGLGGTVGGLGYRDGMDGKRYEESNGESFGGQAGPIGVEFPLEDSELVWHEPEVGWGAGIVNFTFSKERLFRWNISAYLRYWRQGILDFGNFVRNRMKRIVNEVIRGGDGPSIGIHFPGYLNYGSN